MKEKLKENLSSIIILLLEIAVGVLLLIDPVAVFRLFPHRGPHRRKASFCWKNKTKFLNNINNSCPAVFNMLK